MADGNPTKLTDFIATVGRHGIGRNNKYIVILPDFVGETVLTGDRSELQMIQMYADSIDIPGKIVNTTPTRIQGKTYELPSEFMYSGTLNMTFYVDNNQRVRSYFEQWIKIVCPNGEFTSFSPSIPEQYQTTMVIHVVDNISMETAAAKEGGFNPFKTFTDSLTSSFASNKKSPVKANTKEDAVAKYTFYKLYPKSISGYQGNHAGRDFQRMEVSFAFDWFESYYPQTAANVKAGALTKGTGTGIIGSINGIAGNLGGTIGGIGNTVTNLPGKLTSILGL